MTDHPTAVVARRILAAGILIAAIATLCTECISAASAQIGPQPTPGCIGQHS